MTERKRENREGEIDIGIERSEEERKGVRSERKAKEGR